MTWLDKLNSQTHLGRFCSELPVSAIHWTNTFPETTPGQWNLLMYHLSLTGSGRAGGPRTQLIKIYKGPYKDNNNMPMSATPMFQPGQKVWLSTQDIRLRLSCKKRVPDSLVPSPSSIISTPSPMNSNSHHNTGFTLHFTFHVWNHITHQSLLFSQSLVPVKRAPSPYGSVIYTPGSLTTQRTQLLEF